MKKLILIGIGLAGAGAFIGFDAVEAFFHKTRSDVRSKLMSPEVELQAQISAAEELAEQCSESVVHGQMALARLDSMIDERGRELKRREALLDRDRRVLEGRRDLLARNQRVYLVGNEEVSRRTLNRDAVLRAKSYSTDREILTHLSDTYGELKVQRAQTAAEIEEATVEMKRLEEEVTVLRAELENLRARRAVAQTREESKYVFDRSAFDRAREKISEIRATIAQQNRQLDFYGRRPGARKGLIPADVEAVEENGEDAITAVLGDVASDAPQREAVDAALAMNR